MHQIIKILAAITFLMIFISCNEEVLPPEPEPEFAIEGVKVPLRLNVGNPRDYDVSFRVTHPGGAGAIAEVTLTFYGSDQTTQLLQLPLYDDGGFLHDDHDVVAGDGIFTNHFVSDSLVFPVGDVFMRVKAVDNAQENRQTDIVEAKALINAAPVLLSVNAPDTLYSGSQPLLFSVAVQDSNDIEDVTGVVMRLKRAGIEITSVILEFQSKTAADSGIYGAFFDSTFAAERDSLYTLEFQAVDLSDDVSDILTKEIFLENVPPRVFDVELPETFQRPSSGEDTIEVRISANDPQGLGDIDSVRVVVQRMGGSASTIQMFDDGDFENHRDVLAGDGIFSRGLTVSPQSTTGIFFFTFRAVDKVNNQSTTITDSLEILP
jgi:hypothetical protein